MHEQPKPLGATNQASRPTTWWCIAAIAVTAMVILANAGIGSAASSNAPLTSIARASLSQTSEGGTGNNDDDDGDCDTFSITLDSDDATISFGCSED